jgi:hypothetical protein
LEDNLTRPRPIDGRSCWALGFLDHHERSIGCLLHPCRNGGDDLRSLTGFGGKCAREACLEARVYLRLSASERKRCLTCASQDDSFLYSSRLQNPLFRLLAWEEDVVRGILAREGDLPLRKERLVGEYGRLFDELNPRVDGYWIMRLVRQWQWSFLDAGGTERYRRFRRKMREMLLRRWGTRAAWDQVELPMVHLYRIPIQLSRWLKFDVGIWRTSEKEINEIMIIIESELANILDTPHPLLPL